MDMNGAIRLIEFHKLLKEMIEPYRNNDFIEALYNRDVERAHNIWEQTEEDNLRDFMTPYVVLLHRLQRISNFMDERGLEWTVTPNGLRWQRKYI